MNCGLLGRKLGHSYSPQIHAYLGNYSYELYELEPEKIGPFLKKCPLTGLNVTIPYKKDVIRYCSRLTPAASRLGAVNTIIRQPDGSLLGHNTDYFGFLSTIHKTGLCVEGKKALVLGSGGASVTAVTVLKELGASVVTISRSGENNYSNLNLHTDAALIVNATPVGMYPNTGTSPIVLDRFPKLEGVIDLIYNPARTAFLQQAEARGIIAENGLWMLVAQAKESAEWFTGNQISDDVISDIYLKLSQMMQNIVLIGMPGSGKSTIGVLLSQITGREFVDADKYLEQISGLSIPEILKKYGESQFRNMETQVLGELGRQSGIIIATGGGCVTREENYPLLHQNGNIIWIQRDIASLPTDGRPLSQNGKLMEMYAVRKPMYEAFCDFFVDNNATPHDAVNKILLRLKTEV